MKIAVPCKIHELLTLHVGIGYPEKGRGGSMTDSGSAFFDMLSARQELIALMATVKQTRNKRIQLETEIKTWRDRVRLAIEKDHSDLQAQAEVRVRDFEDRIEGLRFEESELNSELQKLKRSIEEAKKRPELSVDADHLLAQLQMLVGEPDLLEEKFKQEEADAALRELKKVMGQEK